MNYLKFLKEKDIYLDIEAKDRNDAIYQITRRFKFKNKDKIFKAVIERENLRTTAIGDGVAIPHARTKLVKEIIIKFAILKKSLDFNASDNKAVNYVFLIIAPYTNTPGYLATIARLVKVVNARENKKALSTASTSSRILKILKNG